MVDYHDAISPHELRIAIDPNCLTENLKHVPREIVGNIADEIIDDLGIDTEIMPELKKRITQQMAKIFYMGAKQEMMLLDETIKQLSESPRHNEERVRWYYRQLAAVCNNAIVYVREFSRRDNAHRGRLVQREETLKSSIEQTVLAWENRFRQPTSSSR